jgi:hypothetical protein
LVMRILKLNPVPRDILGHWRDAMSLSKPLLSSGHVYSLQENMVQPMNTSHFMTTVD